MDTETETTITQKELAVALSGIVITFDTGAYGGLTGQMLYPMAVADIAFRVAKQNREPAYEDEGVYQDAHGDIWQFFKGRPKAGWSEPVWNTFGDPKEYAFDEPKRPLRRLR
jgi:hypothetical protein